MMATILVFMIGRLDIDPWRLSAAVFRLNEGAAGSFRHLSLCDIVAQSGHASVNRLEQSPQRKRLAKNEITYIAYIGHRDGADGCRRHLASDAAGSMTGYALVVDGGQTP